MTESQSLNIAVVGGGPGGYAAAFLAADLGMTVTLIDPELNPGGVCLYRGCIPSKALLHVAKLLEESHQSKDWGIEFAAPKIDLARLRSWKESVSLRSSPAGWARAFETAQGTLRPGTCGVGEFYDASRYENRWLGRVAQLRSHRHCDWLTACDRSNFAA